jgi:hypothetical protein
MRRADTRKWVRSLALLRVSTAVWLSIGTCAAAAEPVDVQTIAPLLDAERAQNPEIRAAEALELAHRAGGGAGDSSSSIVHSGEVTRA